MPQNRKDLFNMVKFNVYLYGKLIDSVFYNINITSQEVKKSLVDHDGYNPNITIKQVKKGK